MERRGQSFRVVRRVALHYRGGADAALDRPGHVRAASGLCWWCGLLAVVSDDASFIGLVDPATGECDPITLPHAPAQRRQFDKARGNKADKLDLESVIAIGDVLVAFGSDSGLDVRRQVVVIDGMGGDPQVVSIPRFYEALRSPTLGRGKLNIEAATVFERSSLVLGNRGGDVGDDGVPMIDAVATIDLAAVRRLIADPEHAPVPPIAWHPIVLGELEGAPLRLTELHATTNALLFAATAEATTTAYDDGTVTGSVIGTIAGPMNGHEVRWCRVVDEEGAPLVAKIEGLVATPDPSHFLIVVDADDPDRPSELLEIMLDGPWT